MVVCGLLLLACVHRNQDVATAGSTTVSTRTAGSPTVTPRTTPNGAVTATESTPRTTETVTLAPGDAKLAGAFLRVADMPDGFTWGREFDPVRPSDAEHAHDPSEGTAGPWCPADRTPSAVTGLLSDGLGPGGAFLSDSEHADTRTVVVAQHMAVFDDAEQELEHLAAGIDACHDGPPVTGGELGGKETFDPLHWSGIGDQVVALVVTTHVPAPYDTDVVRTVVFVRVRSVVTSLEITNEQLDSEVLTPAQVQVIARHATRRIEALR